MPATFIRQFNFECESWKRILYFFREENVYYRNRLSEILNDAVNEELLERSEYFQGNFIMSDETIHWLVDEIHQHIKFLSQNIATDTQILELVIRNHQKLKKDVEKAEEVLFNLKKEFNEFLAESVVGYYN
ncbi:hypothetical protein [Flavisolibacter ginsengisoli]|jgi:hypothetical protein|uniref:Uncharacterized protein n=1 Tax=Flavisolibacter ginsengisoli DSM 18119 TaxID=1121884 RepID=A0A1M4UU19_9BACT|nr:hypothetical protein [Flavisolibacter ginsengisoli]SHE60090.1 hypothetical protein SAMN02745131_00771 [Flavisolibacter ginsengisoli DSM 18119]